MSLSETCKRVVRESLSGQRVIVRSESHCQIVVKESAESWQESAESWQRLGRDSAESRKRVVRESSESHQIVVRESSESH